MLLQLMSARQISQSQNVGQVSGELTNSNSYNGDSRPL